MTRVTELRVEPTAEQRELQESVRGLLARSCTRDDVRRVMGTDSGYDAELWRRMAGEVGVQGLYVPDEFGGAGAGAVEVALAFEELGYAVAPGPYLATAVLAAGCLRAAGDYAAMKRWLPAIASGECNATAALVDVERTSTQRSSVRARQSDDGWLLDGIAELVPDGASADVILVPAHSAGCRSLFAVEQRATGSVVEAMPVLDETRRLARLTLADTPATLVGEEGVGAAVVAQAVQLAQVAVAAEQVGVIRRCLEMTVDYVKTRVQFGRPIGGFQAVKHMCADMYCLLESTRSLAFAAAAALDAADADAGTSVSLAKAFCSDAAVRVSGDSIQLHGAIGFTWEHDCHLLYKRALATARMFGSAQAHRGHVADVLIGA